jgi:hypothetical protein
LICGKSIRMAMASLIKTRLRLAGGSTDSRSC